jgi:ribosomal protein S18 acetylase RimI-like enzyme
MPEAQPTASSTLTLQTADHCWWHCRVSDGDGNSTKSIFVQSDRYPNGSRITLGAATAAEQTASHVVCEALFVAGDVAPPVWFAEIREPTAQPPAVNLVAFTEAGQKRGALIDEARLASVPVASEDQLGALRWYPGTGQIHQVYVAPAWRRRHIADALLAAAETLSVARDWPGLWANGLRTAVGEEFRNANPWAARAADLTHLAPPMTPRDDGIDGG